MRYLAKMSERVWAENVKFVILRILAVGVQIIFRNGTVWQPYVLCQNVMTWWEILIPFKCRSIIYKWHWIGHQCACSSVLIPNTCFRRIFFAYQLLQISLLPRPYFPKYPTTYHAISWQLKAWEFAAKTMNFGLTHWGRDKTAAIFQTIFSNAFSWMKMYKFRLRFHWSLFPMAHLTIFQHWFR